MRSLTRRLRRLEERFAPAADRESERLVNTLLERRRRRLEAEGVRYEEPVYEPVPYVYGRAPTWAEVLRHRRSQHCAEAEPRPAETVEPTH